MSRQKKQGTAYESDVVRRVRAWVLSWGETTVELSVRRLAEGGNIDEGDVEAWMHADRVVMECKAKQVLSVQDALAKARAKADGAPTVLWWKRLTRKGGATRRTPVAGISEVVVMTPEDLFTLLNNAYQCGRGRA